MCIRDRNENKVAWVLLLIAAIMTAFYMSRLVFMTFFGEKRWGEYETENHELDEQLSSSESEERHTFDPHESPVLMWFPLVALAGLAAAAGILNLPFSHDTKFLEKWLEPILFGNEVHILASTSTKWLLAVIAITGATIGVVSASYVYLKNRVNPTQIELPILQDAWKFDRSVTTFMGGPGRKVFDWITWFDRTVIDGAVNGAGKLIQGIGIRLKTTQTGLIRTYALGMVIGAVAIIAYFVSRMGF